jgi:hypothetical protein
MYPCHVFGSGYWAALAWEARSAVIRAGFSADSMHVQSHQRTQQQYDCLYLIAAGLTQPQGSSPQWQAVAQQGSVEMVGTQQLLISGTLCTQPLMLLATCTWQTLATSGGCLAGRMAYLQCTLYCGWFLLLFALLTCTPLGPTLARRRHILPGLHRRLSSALAGYGGCTLPPA